MQILTPQGTGSACLCTFFRQKSRYLGFLIVSLCALWVAPSAKAAVALTISPSTISNDFSGQLTFSITGLTAGKTVRVERFADLNLNGTIDAGDLLIESFTLTDGVLPIIGGVRNLNVVGDDDNTANGSIQAGMFYPGTDATRQRVGGNFIYRVSDATGSSFTPVTKPFVISQGSFAQGVTGHLYSGATGSPLGNAVVVLASFDGPGGSGAFADATGKFVINSTPGVYNVVVIKNGFYTKTDTSIAVVISNQVTLVSITNPVSTHTISGKISDNSTSQGIPATLVQAKGEANTFSVTFTDANGNYTLPVTSDHYTVGPGQSGLATVGYVGFQLDTNVDILSANVSGVNIAVPKANALIYGTLVDDQGFGLQGISMFAEDQGGLFEADGATVNLNGDYSLGVLAGDWSVGADSQPLAALGLALNGVSVSPAAGQAVKTDLQAHSTAAHLVGQVVDQDSNPLGSVAISANDHLGHLISSQTDANGNFDLKVPNGGSWEIVMDNTLFFVIPVLTINVTDGVDVTGIQYIALLPNSSISGAITEQNGGAAVSGIPVSASAFINGTNYLCGSALSDGGGNYGLAVVDGTWDVVLDCKILLARGYACASDQFPTVDAASPGVADFSLSPFVLIPPDATQYLVAKGQIFRQTGATATAANSNLFSVSVDVLGGPADQFVSGVSVTLPNLNQINLGASFDNYDFEDGRSTLNALNSAYPNGIYTINIHAVHDGDFATPFNLTGDAYPPPPTLKNFTTLQSVNPANDLLMTWNPFTNGSPDDFIQVEIRAGGESVFKTGNVPGSSDALNGTATSVVIPAGVLTPGATYQARVLFGKLVVRDTNTYPGVLGFAAYYKRTDFDIKTGGTSTRPVIVNNRLPGRQVGLAYNAQLTGASGFDGGYTWSVVSGQLPAGLTLNGASGIISGIPTTVGTSSFVIHLRDAMNQTADAAFSIAIYPIPSGFAIATNQNNEIAYSSASSGTNFLLAIQGDASGDSNITAQLVSPTGTLLGSRISTGRTGTQPSVAFGNGNYLLVWQDNATSPSDHIYGQIISADGQLVGTPFQIGDAVGGQKLDSFKEVAFDGVNFLVVFRDDRTAQNPGEGPWFVFGQFVAPDGTLVGANFSISDNQGRNPAVGYNGSQYLVAWTENSKNTDIYAQGLFPNANRVTPNNILVDGNTLPSDNPIDIATDGDNFLVTFEDEIVHDQWNLVGQIINPEAGVVGTRIAISTAQIGAHFPRPVFVNGSYLITWLEGVNSGSPAIIKGRFFDLTGVPTGAEFTFLDNTGPRVPLTDVIFTGKKYLATTSWIGLNPSSHGFDLTDGDIYGQFISFGQPHITSQPQSRNALTGTTVNFDVTATGTKPLVYRWRFNGVDIKFATNATYTLSNVQLASVGNYSVIVSNAFGGVTSDAAVLSVFDSPSITSQPMSTNVSAGTDVAFSVTVTGSGPFTYQWRLNGVNILGATTDTLLITNAQPFNNGDYTVVVANSTVPVALESQVAHLNVAVNDLGFSDDFANALATNSVSGVGGGSNVFASKEAFEPNHARNPGGKSVWYAWKAPGSGVVTFSTLGSSFDTLLAVYTGSTIDDLTPVTSDDNGGGFLTSQLSFNANADTIYYIAMDGAYGASGNIVLSWNLIVGPTDFPQILVQPQSQIASPATNVTLTVIGNTDAGTLEYQWFFNNVVIAGETNSSLTISNLQASNSGNYIVRVTLDSPNMRSVFSEIALVQVGPDPEVAALDRFLDVTPLGTGPTPQAALASGFTGTQIFSTTGATKEPGEPNHCGLVGGASYWYAYRPPVDGQLTIDTIGSLFDTILAVYTSTGPLTNFANLASVTCDDSTSGAGGDMVQFPAVGLTSYYIVVDGVDGASGTVTLHYQLQIPPSIQSGPQDQKVKLGSNVTFTATAIGDNPLHYQWQFNGEDIDGATSNTYSFMATDTSLAGGYSVIVANDATNITSIQAMLTIVEETTAPTLTIASPAANARLSNSVAIVTGTASDNVQVNGVYWQLNSGSYQLATGSNNWSAGVNLTPGTNIFRAYSIDPSGNTSVTNVRTFIYVVAQQLSVSTNGLGTISPSLNGELLEIGKSFTMTAKPAKNQVFAGWTGSVTSSAPVLTFIMQSNVVLQANFVANPFLTRQGTYAGLFFETNAVNFKSSGYFTLKLTSKGTFSSKMVSGGLNLSASGTISGTGAASGTVQRAGLSPLNLSLAIDVTNDTDQITGTVSDGVWTATLKGYRAGNPAPAGKYAIAFDHQADTDTIPGGDGFATLTVAATGGLKLKGILGDGTAISQSTTVSKGGQWPFYANLYSGSGMTLGWLTFTNRTTSSIEGNVAWIKTGSVPGNNYQAGFTNTVVADGSIYPVAFPSGKVLNLTNGIVILDASNIDPPITNSVVLNPDNTLTVSSGTNNLKLTLTATSGAVKGTFTQGVDPTIIPINGIILPQQNVVRGYFLTPTNSGSVLLQGQ